MERLRKLLTKEHTCYACDTKYREIDNVVHECRFHPGQLESGYFHSDSYDPHYDCCNAGTAIWCYARDRVFPAGCSPCAHRRDAYCKNMEIDFIPIPADMLPKGYIEKGTFSAETMDDLSLPVIIKTYSGEKKIYPIEHLQQVLTLRNKLVTAAISVLTSQATIKQNEDDDYDDIIFRVLGVPLSSTTTKIVFFRKSHGTPDPKRITMFRQWCIEAKILKE